MSPKPVSGNSPVDIPKNVVVDLKGYVYLNLGYSIRTSKDGSILMLITLESLLEK